MCLYLFLSEHNKFSVISRNICNEIVVINCLWACNTYCLNFFQNNTNYNNNVKKIIFHLFGLWMKSHVCAIQTVLTTEHSWHWKNTSRTMHKTYRGEEFKGYKMNVTDLYQHDQHGEAIQILFFIKINRCAECFYYNQPMHNYISEQYFFI